MFYRIYVFIDVYKQEWVYGQAKIVTFNAELLSRWDWSKENINIHLLHRCSSRNNTRPDKSVWMQASKSDFEESWYGGLSMNMQMAL